MPSNGFCFGTLGQWKVSGLHSGTRPVDEDMPSLQHDLGSTVVFKNSRAF